MGKEASHLRIEPRNRISKRRGRKEKLLFRMRPWKTEGYRFYPETQRKTALKINQKTDDRCPCFNPPQLNNTLKMIQLYSEKGNANRAYRKEFRKVK